MQRGPPQTRGGDEEAGEVGGGGGPGVGVAGPGPGAEEGGGAASGVAAPPAAPAASPIFPASLWFEVSEHTGRVVVHAAADGSAPLGPSYSSEAASLPPPVAAFLAEWGARTALERALLQRATTCGGHLLRPPLADTLIELGEATRRGLLPGGSKRRVASAADVAAPLPSGAAWRRVFLRCTLPDTPFVERMQAFDASGRPLCVLCMSLARQAMLAPDGSISLGCLYCPGDACEARHRAMTSQGALRRAIFEVERGVCQLCGLDAHRLCERIKVMKQAARRKAVLLADPRFDGEKVCVGGGGAHARGRVGGASLCLLVSMRREEGGAGAISPSYCFSS